MAHYIDKDKIIEYVKKRLIPTVSRGNIDDWERGADNERINFLSYINTLPEEPASEDLEEEINRVDDWYPVELNYIQEIAHHFVEWQKQKDEQDFMKKACEYLKQEHEDIGIRYIRGVSVDEEIELFKEYMKNKK